MHISQGKNALALLSSKSACTKQMAPLFFGVSVEQLHGAYKLKPLP